MFVAVFSLFVAAMLVLVVFIVRWAVRRDRERRSAQTPTDKQP